ncbi:hypothetical protein P40_05440 [Alloalcanivorax xenomutans]|nr:hypothetical protein P40_05440 [Alloalcanivorax xenomutans]
MDRYWRARAPPPASPPASPRQKRRPPGSTIAPADAESAGEWRPRPDPPPTPAARHQRRWPATPG